MNHRLFLQDLGITSALGSSAAETFSNLINGKQTNLVWRDDLLNGRKARVAVVNAQLPSIPTEFTEHNFRCNQLLLSSYLQIQDSITSAIKKYGANRIAVVIGSSTSGIGDIHASIAHYFKNQQFPSDFDMGFLEMGNPAQFLAKMVGINGIAYTVSTACSSSAKAFVSARNLINLDLCDAVLVGGSDSLCQLTVQGFGALESLSSDICNPFSANRDGINIGEGSALFLLSKEEAEIELAGIGESSDAYHIASPDPEGKGALVSMQKALHEANLRPEEIDYINLHGTGTVLNDQMESLAVHGLFGEKVNCSSTKTMTGHALGSSGIIEIGLCWLLLQELNQQRNLPPHLWDGEFDANLPRLNLTKIGAKAEKLKVCLSNSFAFGGSNASIIIRKNV